MKYHHYVALEGVRASDLKALRKSPLHCHEREDGDSGRALRAMHALLLEPEVFDEDFVVFEGKARRGKAYEAFAAEHEGYTILNQREEEAARSVVEGVLRHPVARRLLNERGESEVTLTWTDPDTGLPCKGRLDRLAGGSLIIDAKGYGTSDPREISRRVARLGAHVQLAHYRRGLELARGVRDARVMIISYETRPPYDVAVVELESDALAIGERERAKLMAQYAECLESGKWPGRCPEVVPLILPDWLSAELGDDEDGDYEEYVYPEEDWP